MSLKNFRYLNMSHKDPMRYSVKGSDKPCELHSIFNAMVASTRKQQPKQPKQPEKKKMARYNGKTPDQHLADAKAMTLYGIKVLDETPKKVGIYWQIFIECERCGTQKWVNKNDLTRTKSCGCLKPSNAKPKAEKKLDFGLDAPIVGLKHERPTEPFDLAEPVEIVEEIVETEQKEVMTNEEKTTLMDILEKKVALPKEDFKAFEKNFVKVNSSQCDSNRDENDQKADRVCVSRRLVVGLARECGNQLHDFWNLEPAAFEVAIQDAREIYESLRG